MPRLAFLAVAVAVAVPAAGLRSAPLPPEGRVVISPATGMRFVRVPAGTFLMGSPADETSRERGEDRHEVTLSKAFFLGVNEVNRGQFAAFVAGTGYQTGAETDKDGGAGWDAGKGTWAGGPAFTWRTPGFDQADDHPAVNVSWHDAVAFAGWLSRADGRAYRLPTEAEWEHACRAGTRTRFSFGDDEEDMARHGNVADTSLRRATGHNHGLTTSDGWAFTAPVGRFRANAFGLHDMHGNAKEWCGDWSGPYPPGPATDPAGPPTGVARVVRGGSFVNAAHQCRAAARDEFAPSFQTSVCGFRLAFTPPP